MRSKGILKKKENIGSILLCVSIVFLYLFLVLIGAMPLKYRLTWGTLSIVWFGLAIVILKRILFFSKGILPFTGYNLFGFYIYSKIIVSPCWQKGVIYEKFLFSFLFLFFAFSFIFLIGWVIKKRFRYGSWVDISFLLFPGVSLWFPLMLLDGVIFTYTKLFTFLFSFLFIIGCTFYIYSNSVKRNILVLFAITSVNVISACIVSSIAPYCTPFRPGSIGDTPFCYFLSIGFLFSPICFVVLRRIKKYIQELKYSEVIKKERR